ncbi:MAG: hypothetical protein H8D94_00805 [Candidatus Pelagibacter sp.]|nr:hypothetical protein [Candidatus Pelagibacter sp.]
MDSEAPESSYRKKFPKGKDWVQPTPNHHGFCGLNPDSYHGMEVIAMDIDKHNEEVSKLKSKIKELESEIYFIIRNNKINNNALQNDFNKSITALNQLLQR